MKRVARLSQCVPSTALCIVMMTMTSNVSEARSAQNQDSACLGIQVHDFHVPFYRAVDICNTPHPDLTGDVELQEYAAAWNIPFTVNPAAPAQLRASASDVADTGSHIRGQYYRITPAELLP